MSAILEVRGLTVQLGGREILTPGIDLSLAAGEHTLLLGRSGCGKSTLLRAIAGLIPATTGRIVLRGQVATEGPKIRVAPERRGIGYLPQGGALWPHLTVGRTLAFVLGQGKLPKGQRPTRIRELLAMVELEGFEDRLPATLSGGEAQRVALARALALEPSLVLLDEPLGPLDAELRAAMLGRLEALRRELGFAALHVTHDPREVAQSADRALRLEAGRLEPYELSEGGAVSTRAHPSPIPTESKP
ncbi:MAG: ATP-binding cassette domain-containing protein [Planctomycetota bacterium]